MANAYNEKMIKNDTDYVLVTESTGAIFRVSLLDLLGDLASDENVTMIQMALANKWGVEISEDVAGRKYASGFSLLLHPIWLNGQAYTVGDTVAVDASVYRCIFNHTSNSVNSPTGVNAATFWLLLPEGVKSSFIVRADRFAVMGPDGSGDALMPFTVDIVDGKAVVGVHGQIIVGGSLPFNALSDEAQTTINNSITMAEAQALQDAQTYADGKFVTQMLHQEDIDNLQSQVDGRVVAWFYDYTPTLSNAPASLWTTEALRDQHANDTFTHLITGQSWRWVYDAGAWKWLEIADTATTAALALASKAKDVADNKRRVFVNQPTVPYDIGDLWATGSIISRCVTAKTTAGSYAAGDWVAVADATNYDDYRVSNVKTENSVTTIARPVGGTYYNSGASATGAIKITLPQSWSNTLIKFEVDVRQYSTTKSFTLQLGGYNNTANLKWLNSFAQLAGSTASNNRVRFGHDGTKCCILIGDVTSVWNIPSIVVKDFQASYYNYNRGMWETGWAISIVTDISGITTTADITDTLIDAKSILGQGALATQNTADYGTQVTGTKPPANADSTTTVIGEGLITTGFIGNKRKTDPLLTLGINFDTAEILVGAAAGLKIKSGGGILVEGGGGIKVKDGGALSIEAGGDLILIADSTNPSMIQFKRAPDDTNPIRLYGSPEDAYATTLTVASEIEDTTSVYLGLPTNKLRNILGTSMSFQFNVGKTNEGLVGLKGNSIFYSYAEITATGAYDGTYRPWAKCTCMLENDLGTVRLASSDSTSVTSVSEVTITAPDITITGSNGTKISAPIRTTNPTASEVPNNQVMIYTVGTATRLAANINGTMYIRTL